MRKGLHKPLDTQNVLKELGISIFHSQTSEAFMLIAFMIGDLLFVSKTISSPGNPDLYKELDGINFVNLRNKILKNQAAGEFSHLTLRESISFYILIDIVCKSFIDDNNEILKNLAIQNAKISEEEFGILRINFLRYGQSLIEKMNDKFENNELFRQSLEMLKNSG